MSRPFQKLRQFFRELKRRKVYRVAAVYVATAFVVLQAARLVFPSLAVPSWVFDVLVVLALFGFPIAVVLAWAFETTPEGVRRTEPAEVTGPPADESDSPPEGADSEAHGNKSVAVLPFVDMSPDRDHEYFGDGLAEEVLNALTQLGGLRVAARTSSFGYRGKEVNVVEIGRDLGVGAVLEGSVRKAGDQLRVTAQLVDAREGYHLWSETFDRELEDVFAIQDEITASIVDALHVALLGEEEERLSRIGTENPRAYDLYLKGRHYWQRRYKVGLDIALDFFEAALEEDPRFALAQAGVAEVYWVLGTYGMADPETARDRAVDASERAVELGPQLAESHCARAVVRGELENEYGEAVAHLERALELDPTHARAEAWRSLYLSAWRGGDPERAEAAARRAVELEPESKYVRAVVGLAHLVGRRYGEAANHLGAILREEPEFVLALYSRALVHSRQGEHEMAVELLERAAALTNRASFILALLGAVLGVGGRTADARNLLTELQDRASRDGEPVPPLLLATVEAHAGHIEEALDHLEQHGEAGYPGLGAFVGFGVLDVLRGEPRFQALLDEFELR